MKTTVLLVEDDAQDVEVVRLAHAVVKASFALAVVSDGVEAVHYLSGQGQYGDRLRYRAPDLVLLDLSMPKMDGFDVLRWIQTQPPTERPVVFVLSYSRLESDRRLARELGAERFVVKTLDLNDTVALMTSVDDILKGRTVIPEPTENAAQSCLPLSPRSAMQPPVL